MKRTIDSYMELYFRHYPDDRDMRTAKEFLDRYHESYRHRIMELIDETIRKGGADSETFGHIVNEGRLSIGELSCQVLLERTTSTPSL